MHSGILADDAGTDIWWDQKQQAHFPFRIESMWIKEIVVGQNRSALVLHTVDKQGLEDPESIEQNDEGFESSDLKEIAIAAGQ